MNPVRCRIAERGDGGVECNSGVDEFGADPQRRRADAPRGQYPITVSGSSGALTASTGFTLLVNGPGFMITPQPVYVQLMPGYSTATTFRVTPLGGFAGQVTYAVTSPLPNDVMASWTTDITSGGEQC